MRITASAPEKEGICLAECIGPMVVVGITWPGGIDLVDERSFFDGKRIDREGHPIAIKPPRFPRLYAAWAIFRLLRRFSRFTLEVDADG